MKRILLFLVISIFFIRCDIPNGTPAIKHTFSFKTYFEPTFRYSGSFIEKKTGIEYLYFADPMTTKCLKIFQLNGQLSDSIPLKDAMDYIVELNGLTLESKDRIILNSSYTNLLIIINSKGQIIHKSNMNNLLKNPNGDKYELYSSFFGKTLLENSIIFYREWRYNEYDTTKYDNYHDIMNFHKKNFATPYFYKIKYYTTDTPIVSVGPNNLLSKLCKNTDAYNDIPRYTCLNNKIFFYSLYSNKLYVINSETFLIEKTIEINSKLTKIGANPIPLNQNTIENMQIITDSISATTGQLLNLFYNKGKAKYYLYIYHAVPSSLEKEIGYKKLPYSILTMDTSFNYLKEYKMDANKYWGGFSIMTNEGLIINKQDTNSNKDGIFTNFTLFDL